MYKERLERGRKRSFAGAFFAEKVKYGKMSCAVEDDIAVESGEQVAESDFGVVAENPDELHGEVVELYAAAVFVYEKPLELIDFGVVLIHFRCGRDIERPVGGGFHDAEVIDGQEPLSVENTVAESEEAVDGVPAHLADTLCGAGAAIEIFLYVVELVNLGSPYIIADGADALLKCSERAKFGLPELNVDRLVEFVYHAEQTCAVGLVFDMVKGFEEEI